MTMTTASFVSSLEKNRKCLRRKMQRSATRHHCACDKLNAFASRSGLYYKSVLSELISFFPSGKNSLANRKKGNKPQKTKIKVSDLE